MSTWSAAPGVIAVLASGCAPVFEETTFVRLRRPEPVRVEEETPGGGRAALLPEDGPPQRAELAPSEPPFTEKVLYAEVERTRIGAVSLSCPSCTGHPEASVIPRIGEIELRGPLGRTIAWSEDRLSMRWSHEALFRCYRSRGLCPREAVALDLSTPQANVVQIRHQKRLMTEHGERVGAKIGIVFGLLDILLGSGLAVGTSVAAGHAEPLALGIGAAFVGAGTFFLGTGIEMLRARSVESVVYDASGAR